MASQWIIAPRNEGFDVLWREIMPKDEIFARTEMMREHGLSARQISLEIAAFEGSFTKCNKDGTKPLTACYEFVFTYAKPGDTIIDGRKAFVFCAPATA